MVSLSRVKASCTASGSNFFTQFPRNLRSMDTDLYSMIVLFYYCLIKGFNLIPLYQTELGVFFIIAIKRFCYSNNRQKALKIFFAGCY